MKQYLIVLLCLSSALALFSDDSTVVKLTASNFKDLVLNSDDFWLVEFYGISRYIKRPGAVIANDLPLSLKKQLKF